MASLPNSPSRRRNSLASQLTLLSLGLILVLIAVVAVLGWWTVQRIDEQSALRQMALARVGLEEQKAKLPVEQDSSAIWDDAVRAVRSNDAAWLAENLVEWMSEYYHQDRVYILTSANTPLRAANEGKLVDNDAFAKDASVVMPLVSKLRQMMADGSQGASDSTSAVNGMGTSDYVSTADGGAAIVSVRPVIPSSPAVTQAPGTEFLLVSIKAFGPSLLAEISKKFRLDNLGFDRSGDRAADAAVLAVTNEQGRILGFLHWKKDNPGTQLVREIGPVLLGSSLLALVIVSLLVVRLRRVSNELQASESQATYLAFHDPLTSIPNRALFEDRLDRALAAVRRSGGKIALHYLDLDRFKHVNDTLGHSAGDELIRQVAKRLTECVRDTDTVARLGGDEFAIIQSDVEDDRGVEALAKRIISAIDWPFDIGGDEVLVGISVGVVLSIAGQSTAEDLMRKADIALYEAKANGRGRYHVFIGDMDEVVRRRRALERDLRAALATETQLKVVYQPLFDPEGQRVLGAEALVRWDHPEQGTLSPDLFIGVAEERGLIDALTIFVLRKACSFALAAQLPWVAVNFSPLQFLDEHLPERILRILKDLDFPPERLEIEITEGLLMQNTTAVKETLARLREAGIRIALDDFGTGYSSITYLRTYRIDKLKIDRSFVDQIAQPEIQSIIRAIMDLAHALSMEVTAEGVETVEQHRILRCMGCSQLQGYLFSKPVSPDDLVSSMARKIDASPQPHEQLKLVDA